MPQISVIVPVYKVEKYIYRCVDSILGQTYADFELILVDDGSPDNCGAICDEYAAKDSRVVVIHQENGGLSAARNAGIDWAFTNSDSQWISFIDSDDWVHSHFWEALIGAAQKCDTQISCCLFQRIKDGEMPKEIPLCVPHLSLPEEVFCSKDNNYVHAYPWRFLYAKCLFNGIYFPHGKIYEDIFTTHKLIFQCTQLAVVDQALYFYLQRDNSIVHSTWDQKQLDMIAGYEALIQYSNNSGNIRMQLCAKRGYIFAIHLHYRKALGSNLTRQDKANIEKKLRRKMRIALFRYAKDAGFCFTKDNYLYCIAYPKLLTVYWHIRGILSKFS